MAVPGMENMDRAKIQAAVIDVLADKLDVAKDQIVMEALLVADLGMDSFGAIELMFELESQWGLDIPDQDVRQFVKVVDIVDYLEKRLAEKK